MLHADTFLGQASGDVKKSLQPDLLISFGQGLMAKQLKLFLRKYSPTAHWHIQPSGQVADSFQHLTKIIRATPADFFKKFSSIPSKESFDGQRQQNYFKLWEIEERKTIRSLETFFPAHNEFGEFELVNEIISALPFPTNLHLANSMSVRYANLIGLVKEKNDVRVFCNRGTSGIDGCSSTAVGHSLVSQRLNLLITGDMAFFYDRNAFWHNYTLPNLRIVLLNNHGGVIFKMIDGPADLPETDEFFVTRQKLNAQKAAEEFGFEYIKLDHRRKVKNLVKDFFDESNVPKILELETTQELSKAIFEKFKTHIRKNYEL
jgi:2-succinyl-5-enolpyruvyl-6-hydroxy-3-cyclohexene-1-carboxylate synthase